MGQLEKFKSEQLEKSKIEASGSEKKQTKVHFDLK